MKPYFSIVIPLYNKEAHINATLVSVFNQSFKDFELIIVNDGSTDRSLDIVSTFKDKRVQIINKKNEGVSTARNLGIEKAKAKLIAFLDADDIWYPNHLEDLKTLNELYPNCGIYATSYVKEKYRVKFTSIFKNIPKDENWKGVLDNYFKSTLSNSIASGSSVMIPKIVFDKIGTFNEQYNSGEDTDMWIRIALKYPVAFSNKVSVVHNMDAANKITNIKLSERKHIDINTYETYCSKTLYLKQYLDLNRVSMALQYKLEGQRILEHKIKEHINYSNLNLYQKILLKMPKDFVLLVYKFRNVLKRLNFDLRLFR